MEAGIPEAGGVSPTLVIDLNVFHMTADDGGITLDELVRTIAGALAVAGQAN